MDRPLDTSVKHRQRIKRVVTLLAIVVVGLAAFGAFRRVITPTVRGDRIRTAVVEEGPIEVTISAGGLVVPQHEEVVSSPFTSHVVEIHKRLGEFVHRGDPILSLQSSTIRLALENLSEQIAVKANARRTQELETEKTLIDLRSRHELKSVDLEGRQATAARLTRLYEDGLAAEDQVLEAQLNIRRTEIELRQLQESMDNLRQSTQAESDRIELEKGILLQQRAEQQRLLDLATVRAARDGVLTFAVEQEGTSVREGDVLARVADLTRFQVEASLSDIYAPRLRQAMPARVMVAGRAVRGVLETIKPTIDSGTVTVIVRLDEPDPKGFRPNMRVDTYLITDRREQAKLVQQGPFVNGSGKQPVFVVREGRAYRTAVEIGLESYDQVEIVSGLQHGDEVIISDMTAYLHMPEVRIR